MPKKTARRLVTALMAPAALAAALAFAFAGCSREVPEQEQLPGAASRLEDGEYRNTLLAQEKIQRGILEDKARTDAELAKALEEDPEGTGERVQALRKEQEEIYKRFKENREQSKAIVRQRILEDAAKNNLNEKGTR